MVKLRQYRAIGLGLLLSPVLLVQALYVRLTVPRLPEAPGPRTGVIEGAGAPLRLLVVGESPIAGVGAASHADSLAGETARALANATGRPVHWRVLGRNGVSARETRTELVETATDLEADVAVIGLGVNDTLRFHSPRRWQRDLARLMDALRARCGDIPMVLGAVPPMHLFPALPAPLSTVLGLHSQVLDDAARKLAQVQKKLIYVPMPPLFDADVTTYFCEDRFHPSPLGCLVWGQALAAAAATPLRGVL